MPGRSSRIATPRRCFKLPSILTHAALLAARPSTEHPSRLATIPGAPPGLQNRPAGCLFGPRCAYATRRAQAVRPDLRDWMEGLVRCHYPLGDPDRDARIAADGLVGGEPTAVSALVVARDLERNLRGGAKLCQGGEAAAGGGRGLLRDHGGPDPGGRGRIGLRKIDPGALP